MRLINIIAIIGIPIYLFIYSFWGTVLRTCGLMAYDMSIFISKNNLLLNIAYLLLIIIIHYSGILQCHI